MIEPQVAIEKLTGMGTTKEIAKYLEGEGITGHQTNAKACPVARYLQRETEHNVQVTIGHVMIVGRRIMEVMYLPQHLSDFIVEFDAGYYPELIIEREK